MAPVLIIERRAVVRASLALAAMLLVAAGGFAYYRTVFVQPSVRLTGVVSADRVIVTSQVGGAIRQLAVDEGSWVREGDLIAMLERDELEAEKSRQLARIRELESKRTQSRELVRLETERGQSEVANATAELRLAQSKLEEARAEQRQREKDVDYHRTLQEEGLATRQEQERLETDLQVGEARVRSAEDQVRAAQAELDFAVANERQVRVTTLDVDQTEALLDQANAELAQITVRLEHSEIRSPVDGLVSLRVANQGEIIKPGDPIVTVVELDDTWVRAEVEESQIGRVKVGQPLTVELASGERVEGRVDFISPEADFATQRDVSRLKRDIKTFAIKVRVPNEDHRVHPGMTAYVLLH